MRYFYESKAKFSNGLVEAIKTRLKDGKRVKVYKIPCSGVKNKCLSHYYWKDRYDCFCFFVPYFEKECELAQVINKKRGVFGRILSKGKVISMTLNQKNEFFKEILERENRL